jgi:hypothetical protein
MGIPMIKVAREGYDATTAAPRYLTIDSTKNQFKAHIEGTGVAEFEARDAWDTCQKIEVDIEHNLGYQPTYIFSIMRPDEKVRPSPFIGSAGSGSPDAWEYVSSGVARVDDDILRLYFYIWDPFLDAYDAFDVDYRYIIFVDPNKNVWS